LLSKALDSGHGGQTKDLDGDEADGYDEGESDFPKYLCASLISVSVPNLVIYPVSSIEQPYKADLELISVNIRWTTSKTAISSMM